MPGLHDFKTGIFASSKGADSYMLSPEIATVRLQEMIFFFRVVCLKKRSAKSQLELFEVSTCRQLKNIIKLLECHYNIQDLRFI